MPDASDCGKRAERFNRERLGVTLDRAALRAELLAQPHGEDLWRMIAEDRPHLFADAPVFIPETCAERQARIVAAIETVIILPAYQHRALTYAPETAHFTPKARGVFFGYDFHLGADGPQLIEINSNAGGALLNALLHRAQLDQGAAGDADVQTPEQVFWAMFEAEWRLERGDRALRRIAIVDSDPLNQFLYPEFLLFRNFFERHGVAAVICDPGELQFQDGELRHDGKCVDLVYNRLTDFGLQEPAQQPLRDAYLAGAVVLTPHPRAHALYADKRNMALLCDAAALTEMGVDAETQALLLAGIARTTIVREEDADRLWAERKRLFFKPAAGYGSKAAYRGDKLTRRVFEEILRGDYVAQALVLPSQRRLNLDGAKVELKLDLRAYVYQGRVQMLATRLYQGQTTNFRTPGGGFAPVVTLPCIDTSPAPP